MCDALEACDIDKALSIIKSAIADLPTIVKKDMCENYYESVTHLMFRMTGWRVVSELQSVAGRSDVVVATKDSVFIFELKMDRSLPSLQDRALYSPQAYFYLPRNNPPKYKSRCCHDSRLPVRLLSAQNHLKLFF